METKDPIVALAKSRIKKHFEIIDVFPDKNPQLIKRHFSSVGSPAYAALLELNKHFSERFLTTKEDDLYHFRKLCDEIKSLLASYQAEKSTAKAVVEILKLGFIVFNIYYKYPIIGDPNDVLILIEEMKIKKII